jgi:hypothetical protein
MMLLKPFLGFVKFNVKGNDGVSEIVHYLLIIAAAK